MGEYVDAAVNEWKLRCHTAPAGIDTIYIGGGTPSSLPPELLLKLLSSLPVTDRIKEFTIEANPEDVTPAWVKFIREYTAIDRVSMGIQSFSDEELKIVGRRHTAADAVSAYELLRSEGIGNISCDLIYGLPGQTFDSWRRSLDRLISLRPEHVSAYLLSFEEGTRLYAMLSAGKVSEADEGLITEMYDYLCEALRSAGYVHYEISNFALPGKKAVHNSAYWDGSPYIGIGPGAYSWDGANRSYNPSNLRDYIASGGENFGVMEIETVDNRFNDSVMTSLRTLRGLDLDILERDYGTPVVDEMKSALPPLIEQGYLCLSDDNILTIPEKHWLISNSILLPLIRV